MNKYGDVLLTTHPEMRFWHTFKRKARLCELIRTSKCDRLLYAQHVEQYGKKFFEEICSRDLEGILGKRKMSVYKPGGSGWLKIKNQHYTQAEGRHELLSKQRITATSSSRR